MSRKLFLVFFFCFSFTIIAGNETFISFDKFSAKKNYRPWKSAKAFSFEVISYQRMLWQLGYNSGPIDGILGQKTKKAIMEFQRDNNLTPDGIIGPKTKKAMYLKLYPGIYNKMKNPTYFSQPYYQPSISLSYSQKKHTSSQNYIRDYKGRLVPTIAENKSYHGQISKSTGRPKVIYVNGYYRRDGTYVRSHYRSRPRGNSSSIGIIWYIPIIGIIILYASIKGIVVSLSDRKLGRKEKARNVLLGIIGIIISVISFLVILPI